jgi:hypothetical protein
MPHPSDPVLISSLKEYMMNSKDDEAPHCTDFSTSLVTSSLLGPDILLNNFNVSNQNFTAI